MQTLLDRIILLMSEMGWNKSDLSRAMDLSTASVSLMFKRLSTPSHEATLKLLRAVPDLSSSWLFAGEGAMFKKDHQGYHDYPISGEIAAGNPTEIYELPKIEFISVSLDQISTPNEYLALRVYGDSMAPVIIHGDVILLHTVFDPFDLDGKVAAVKIDQEVTLKRIWINDTARQTVLLPYNYHYNPIVLSEDSPDCRILGYMTNLVRNF